MPVKVSVDHPKENISRIVLDGRLDVAGAQAAEAEFNAAVAASQNVIVDLGKVPFIASLGIRLLVAGAQASTKQGGKMVLMRPDDLSRRILKTTGIDQLIPICNGLDDALASF
jgi:anti-anti-sigma factor